MNNPSPPRHGAVLTASYVACLLLVVAVPLWVTTLIQHYFYQPSGAALAPVLLLAGAVASSAGWVVLLGRLPPRLVVSTGFALAAVAMALASQIPEADNTSLIMAALHLVAGLGLGGAMAPTAGAMACSANPHRLFAVANTVLAFVAVAFLAAMPPLVVAQGPAKLFIVSAVLMGGAALLASRTFPRDLPVEKQAHTWAAPWPGLRPMHSVWLVAAAIVSLSLNQALVSNFLQKIGASRGFDARQLDQVFVAMGVINLVPCVLAALLQARLSAVGVGIGGLLAQAALAVLVANTTSFAPYAVAAALSTFVMMFTLTFLFGQLAQLDTTGRIAPAVPALLIVGAFTGLAVGVAAVSLMGYRVLGLACALISCAAAAALWQLRRRRGYAAAATAAG